MDFGRVDEIGQLDQIDFRLPEDSLMTREVLNSRPSKPLRVSIGCAKWGRPDWLGKVYPAGVKEKDFLSWYVKTFNSIELNAFFYRIFPPETVRKWAQTAGTDFLFCPKFTQSITHIKRLKQAELVTDQFLNSINAFGEKLGSTFLQLSPNFAVKSFPDLENYLRYLPADLPVSVEFRHPGWFEGNDSERAFQMLRDLGKGTVITDAAGRRDCVHMHLSNKTAFIRFVGNNLHPTDFIRIDLWVERLKEWMDQGLEQLYFFVHNQEEINSPELCRYVIRQMNSKCGTKIPEPIFLDGIQSGLF